MTHTPGPWHADWDDNGQWYIEPLGITGTRLRGDSGECVESANAHLIAASPELLDAARDALLRLRERGTIGDSPSIRLLGTAIAKAEGR